jgi:HK97 family phage major capsid protein
MDERYLIPAGVPGVRFQRDDDDSDDRLASLETTVSKLGTLIEGIREDATRGAMSAVDKFVEKLENERSRKPPVPPKEGEGKRSTGNEKGENRGGNAIEARSFRVLGDARAGLYRKLETRHQRSSEELEEFRAARNPRMDDLTFQWVKAVEQRNIGERVRLFEEMNGRYLEELGFSRAPLLEGAPDADSGFAAGTGAELLPLPLAGQLMMERDKASKMRQLVTTFPMSTQTQRIPVLPTVTATSRAENASYVDNTPNPDSALLSAKDIGVLFSAGRNFLEDSAFNIASQLTVVAGGAIGAEEDVQICTSTANGGDITEGLDAATITDIAETTTGTLGYVDVVALYYGLPEQYRRNARFFATSTTLADVMRVVDGNGRPIFVSQFEAPRMMNDLDGSAVGVLFGKPIYEVPLADDVLLFGDPAWYAFGNRSGIRVDSDRAVTTGLRQWVIDERVDGRVIPTSVVGTNNAWRKIVF